jgi:ketosteroid isomerase-like protein
MDDTRQQATNLLQRLLRATNEHDLDGLVSCFADDYINETPAHPDRAFQGREQVRRNWTMIFGAVPDIRAELTRSVVDGDTVWTEWEMSGNRRDGAVHLMRGVMIFGMGSDVFRSVRFYLEPVEQGAAGHDAHIAREMRSAAAAD